MVVLGIILEDLRPFNILEVAGEVICAKFFSPLLACNEPRVKNKGELAGRSGKFYTHHSRLSGGGGTYMALAAATSNFRARKKRSKVKVSSLSL